VAVIKQYRNVSKALKVATSTLLSSITVVAHAADTDNEWLFDGAILHYSEKDRVQVLEPVFAFRKYEQFDDFIDYRITIDSMTGATPNGATPSNAKQTFSGASGQSGYTVAAGETPLREFSDTRIALNVTSETPLSSVTRRSSSVAISFEQDYASLGYSSSYSKDYDGKHTTLTAGAGINLDLVYPNGGAPEALANINEPNNQSGGGGDDEGDDDDDEGESEFDPEFKGMLDVLLGVTQVVNRYTLVQLNYSHSFIQGYLTDPYKIVSVVDSVTGEQALTPTTTNGIYLTEKRPDSRDTNSLYFKSVVNVFGDVLRLSYRYYWDDWGINSNTIDVRYRFEIGDTFYIQPHYRYYTQTAADFYRHSLRDNEVLPKYVSADFRLGDFVGKTVGFKIGADFGGSSKFDIRVEQYTQTGESHPDDAVGFQRNFDLYPTLDAVIIQVSYSKFF